MADYLIVRGLDHVLLGVRWSGMSVTTTAAGSTVEAVTDDARLVLTFPPQHVGEETSAEHSPAPLTLISRYAGDVPQVVPGWRAVLAGPSRLCLAVARGTRVPVTVEGLLAAAATCPVLAAHAVPGPDDTAIELPWRLLIVPQARRRELRVFGSHPAAPVLLDGVTGLWRTRLVAKPDAAASPPLADAGLAVLPVDRQLADSGDPPFRLPVGRAQRTMIVDNATAGPAWANRLELSVLGATADIAGVWENFEWEQHTALGRDIRVRTAARGALYPLGHRAEYVEYTERVIDPGAGGAAVLRLTCALKIIEPVRPPPGDERSRRAFPFDDVVITRRTFTDLAGAEWRPWFDGRPAYFWPSTPGGPLAFPIECHTPRGAVRLDLPLIFVANLPGLDALADPGLAEQLAREYGQPVASLPGVAIDLVRAPEARDGDVHEVHSLTFAGGLHTDGYRPRIAGLEVALPALRSLLGDDARRAVTFADEYLARGAPADLLLRLAAPIDIGFARQADRSGGLVAPDFSATGVSRTLGPVNVAALPPGDGPVNPFALFPPEATVLGFPLRELVSQLRTPPQITPVIRPGAPPAVHLSWRDVRLRTNGPFLATDATRLDLTADITPDGSATTCVLRDFALMFPPGEGSLLKLTFGSITFTQQPGRRPDLAITGLNATFLGSLRLLEELGKAVDLGSAAPHLDVTPSGIAVRYSVPVPPVSAGVFTLRNVVLHAGVDVPFDGRPVSVSLSFAERAAPFGLGVLMFAGGGYIDLAFDRDGLRRLEAALEFGAILAVDFLVASGEVHALGGIRFALEPDKSVTLTGYLRVGGCIEVLGLVSVSIEIRIELSYQSARNAMVGRASVVVEVDLTLWSDSVTIDSGEWVLAGGSTRAVPIALAESSEDEEALRRWREYRAAFAPNPAGGQP